MKNVPKTVKLGDCTFEVLHPLSESPLLYVGNPGDGFAVLNVLEAHKLKSFIDNYLKYYYRKK